MSTPGWDFWKTLETAISTVVGEHKRKQKRDDYELALKIATHSVVGSAVNQEANTALLKYLRSL